MFLKEKQGQVEYSMIFLEYSMIFLKKSWQILKEIMGKLGEKERARDSERYVLFHGQLPLASIAYVGCY